MEQNFRGEEKENGQTDRRQIYELYMIKHKRMKSGDKKHVEDKVKVRCAHRSRRDSSQFSPLWTFAAYVQVPAKLSSVLVWFFSPALHRNITSRHLNAPYRRGDYSANLFGN